MNMWHALITRYGRKKVYFLAYLLGVGVIAGAMSLLGFSHLYHSSLLYILIPYCVSLLVTIFRSYEKPKSATQRYMSHVLTALSVLVSTSLLIGEGFICILFFAPIYFLVVTITYLVSLWLERKRGSGNKHYSMILPVIVILLSSEGTISWVTFPRASSVEVERSTHLSVKQIKENLAKPFDLNVDRHWLISIFPMPYRIDAGSLREGDIHTIYTRYHRWFVANTHEGQAKLLFDKNHP